MSTAAIVSVGIVAAIHFFLLYVETCAWGTRGGGFLTNRDKLPEAVFSPEVKALPQNIGLYNGFLAAGLTWSLFIGDADWARNVAVFFLVCVSVAGVVGWLTADWKLLIGQTAFAVIALVLVL